MVSGRREPRVPDGVLGMLVFVCTEAMLFAGMISAFTIVKASATTGWPPAGQPRLPIEVTGLNTVALLLSGVALYVAGRRFAKSAKEARGAWLAAFLLGATFVFVQGAEWVMLIERGLTLTSSQLGSFFYLIVGCHALHAVGALLGMLWATHRLFSDQLTRAQLSTVQVLWFFVVGIWPLLYLEVYL